MNTPKRPTQRTDNDHPNADEHAHDRDRDASPQCAFTACWAPVAEAVEHPQRGEIAVCAPHARRIRELPWQNFPETETGMSP